MKVATGAQMKQLDSLTIEECGIPGIVLMENAGLKVVESIEEFFNYDIAGKRIMIFVGKGNNGGDGLVAARHLHNKKARVKIYLSADPGLFAGDAAVNMSIISKMHIPVYQLDNEASITRMNVAMKKADLLVDALFGTGFKGVPKGRVGNIIRDINRSEVPVIAVDIPSGLEADTGKVRGQGIKADITVTFGLPKIGLLIEPGATMTGTLKIVDISIPTNIIDRMGLKIEMPTRSWCKQQLPERISTSHKGTFGHVVVIGGSNGMSGAPVLAGKAALKFGAGLVTIAVPRSLQQVVAAQVPEALTKGLPEAGNSTFSQEALSELLSITGKASAVVIGPGLSTEETVKSLFISLMSKMRKPTVVDADGLNILANISTVEVPRKLVITPHPGEMGRLLGISTAQVQSDRLQAVIQAAKKYKAVTVLKGTRSLTATPEECLYINTTGNPGMATAGTGDVLAGMIGSLLAQGLSADCSAAVATFIHGWAADAALEDSSIMGLTAGDVLGGISKVLQSINR